MPPPTNSPTVRITLYTELSEPGNLNRHITLDVPIAEVDRVSMTMNSAIDGLYELFRAAVGATSDATPEKGNE